MKNLFYAIMATVFLVQSQVTMAALELGKERAAPLAGTVETIDNAIITFLNTISVFLTLVAVLYAVWGGFVILTAAGDEEKVKKGRTVIFHAILGLIVIFFAYSIILWVVNILTGAA